jgi:hypothetical protein
MGLMIPTPFYLHNREKHVSQVFERPMLGGTNGSHVIPVKYSPSLSDPEFF